MKHLLYNIPYEILIKELSQREDQGLVTTKTKNHLVLFNYTPECSFSKSWDIYTKSARGLVFDTKNKCLANLVMPKFMNYGEPELLNELPPPLPNLPFDVTEKLDGSLINIFYHDNKWQTATRGSFESEQASWADEWLHTHINLSDLNTSLTYCCEAIYPQNRIVVNYGNREELVFLTAYDKSSHSEFVDETKNQKIPFTIARRLQYSSIDDLLLVARQLSHNEEGFVVRFSNGYRIKIKGDEYCRIHKLISNITPLRVWDVLQSGMDDAQIIRKLPEEFLYDYNRIKSVLLSKHNNLLNSAHQIYNEIMKSRRKWSDDYKEFKREFAHEILKKCGTTSDLTASLLFSIVQKKNISSIIWKSLRPKNQQLEGYTPSTLLNRFEGDNG